MFNHWISVGLIRKILYLGSLGECFMKDGVDDVKFLGIHSKTVLQNLDEIVTSSKVLPKTKTISTKWFYDEIQQAILDKNKIHKKMKRKWSPQIQERYVEASRNVKQKVQAAKLAEEKKITLGPVVTDNGNFILDWIFENKSHDCPIDWQSINNQITLIPGVIETGLFVHMAKKAYFGMEDGSVMEQEKL